LTGSPLLSAGRASADTQRRNTFSPLSLVVAMTLQSSIGILRVSAIFLTSSVVTTPSTLTSIPIGHLDQT